MHIHARLTLSSRHEARNCPEVVVAHIKVKGQQVQVRRWLCCAFRSSTRASNLRLSQTAYTPVLPRASPSKKCHLPDPNWERVFASSFAELRQALVFHRSHRRPQPPPRDTPWLPSESGEHASPATSTIMSLDHVTTISALQDVVEGLEEKEALDRQDALWLFALLARLEKPLDADSSSLLRSLYRRCAAFRSELVRLQSFACSLSPTTTDNDVHRHPTPLLPRSTLSCASSIACSIRQ